MKQATLKNDQIIITFPYDPALIGKIRALSGRRWHPTERHWSAILSTENLENLRSWGFEIDPQLSEWMQMMAAFVQELPEGDLVIEGLKKELFPFQKKGVQFIDIHKGRALIADQMGLGKTVQALAWLQLHKADALPAMVICPASLKLNWAREIEKWTTLRVCIWSGRNGKTSYSDSGNTDVHIINYDVIYEEKDDQGKKTLLPRQDMPDIKTIIMDESHAVKNSKAKRTKAALMLCKKAKYVIALTGTPITNRPIEMYNTLSAIAPGLFPSFWKYAMRYCGAKHNRFGWDFTGASNTQELHDTLVRTVMIRRLKSEVMKELPEKTRILVPMEIDNRDSYQKAERDLIAWLKEQGETEKAESAGKVEFLARLEYLKQVAAKGKLAGAIEWIADFIENDEKLVVFCTHHDIVDALMERFSGVAVKLDGRDSIEARQKAIDAFQSNEKIRLFVGNIKAAGVGITLTAASNTAFLELGWTPGEHDQAEDRVHRIGQTAESVSAYYLIAEKTIEEEIAALLDKKRKVLDAVLDGKDTEEESLLTELLKRWRED